LKKRAIKSAGALGDGDKVGIGDARGRRGTPWARAPPVVSVPIGFRVSKEAGNLRGRETFRLHCLRAATGILGARRWLLPMGLGLFDQRVRGQ